LYIVFICEKVTVEGFFRHQRAAIEEDVASPPQCNCKNDVKGDKTLEGVFQRQEGERWRGW
jgi:hypothetical protein